MNWRNYFEQNAKRDPGIPWEHELVVEDELRAPLIHTLQRFQIGESGEGKFLKKWAAQTGDADFAVAIDLFVKEEQEHSRMMALLLERLEAPLLDGHWTDTIFVFARRLGGLQFEIMIFLVAEIIAKRFFRALHDGTRSTILRAVFGRIVREEHAHVAFNCDALRRLFAGQSLFQKAKTKLVWKIIFRLTCLMVMYDHRKILRAVQLSPARFWRDCGELFDRDLRLVFPRATTAKLRPTRTATESHT